MNLITIREGEKTYFPGNVKNIQRILINNFVKIHFFCIVHLWATPTLSSGLNDVHLKELERRSSNISFCPLGGTKRGRSELYGTCGVFFDALPNTIGICSVFEKTKRTKKFFSPNLIFEPLNKVKTSKTLP